MANRNRSLMCNVLGPVDCRDQSSPEAPSPNSKCSRAVELRVRSAGERRARTTHNVHAVGALGITEASSPSRSVQSPTRFLKGHNSNVTLHNPARSKKSPSRFGLVADNLRNRL
jgi:hypothetical protein